MVSNLVAPRARLAWLGAIAFQQLQEGGARNIDRAHAQQVSGGDLTIDDGELPALELGDQRDQRDFGGVADPTEHGFTIKYPAQ